MIYNDKYHNDKYDIMINNDICNDVYEYIYI